MITSERDAASALSLRARDRMHYDIHGYRATVSVRDDDARAAVARILAGFACPEGTGQGDIATYALDVDADRRWSVRADASSSYRTVDPADALVALEWRLVTDMLAYRSDLFHVHGASLLAPDRTWSLLIPGISGSGKTTLALGLMARGFLPYADDVTLIDPGLLAPHTTRRAFHIDATTRALIEAFAPPGRWDFEASPPGYFLPDRWAERAAPISLVLFPTLRPGEAARLTALSIAAAATALLPYSVTLAHAPAIALAAAARLTGRARCYSLTTGDLAATVDLISNLVAPPS